MDRTVESPEAVGFDATRLDRIKPVMQSFVDKRGFAGLSTMLARHNRVVHFEQVGWQDREKGFSSARLSGIDELTRSVFGTSGLAIPTKCHAALVLQVSIL